MHRAAALSARDFDVAPSVIALEAVLTELRVTDELRAHVRTVRLGTGGDATTETRRADELPVGVQVVVGLAARHRGACRHRHLNPRLGVIGRDASRNVALDDEFAVLEAERAVRRNHRATLAITGAVDHPVIVVSEVLRPDSRATNGIEHAVVIVAIIETAHLRYAGEGV